MNFLIRNKFHKMIIYIKNRILSYVIPNPYVIYTIYFH